MKKYSPLLKQKARHLRREGNTYSQISETLRMKVPKNTLSYWLRDIELSGQQLRKIEDRQRILLNMARGRALAANKIKRDKYLEDIKSEFKWLKLIADRRDVSLVGLGILYFAEGSKSTKGTVMFGNSDPSIIRLFVNGLKKNFKIDKSKFRCTVQCRADQDTAKLENYWAEVTRIPLRQFYKSQIDPRTAGKPTKKSNYMGVCRINYLSSEIDIKLKTIYSIITEGR